MKLTNFEISTILSDLESFKSRQIEDKEKRGLGTNLFCAKSYESGFDESTRQFLVNLLTMGTWK